MVLPLTMAPGGQKQAGHDRQSQRVMCPVTLGPGAGDERCRKIDGEDVEGEHLDRMTAEKRRPLPAHRETQHTDREAQSHERGPHCHDLLAPIKLYVSKVQPGKEHELPGERIEVPLEESEVSGAVRDAPETDLCKCPHAEAHQ